MTSKRSKVSNRTEAYTRRYNLTTAQVSALKSVFGNGWTKLSKPAIDAALVTMGK